MERQIAEKAPEIFNRAGVTLDRLARRVDQLLDAKKVEHFTSIVLETKEKEALETQAKAVDFGLRVHGAIQKKSRAEDKLTIESNKIIGSGAQAAAAVSGRKPARESRAAEFRHALISWKQKPESSRPSLRALAIELGTTHQLLAFYLKGLDRWLAEEKATRIRARAEAEGREMTMRECCDAIITPSALRQIESIQQKAKRSQLHWGDVRTLKLWARHFPQAQELWERYRHRALKRKSFAEIMKETPWQEGEMSVAWVRRIWDQCEKYGTNCPTVIDEALLEKYWQGKVPPDVHLSNLITRLEAIGGILLLDSDRILYFAPSGDVKARALLAELSEHREDVKKLMMDLVGRCGAAKYEEIKAKICQRIPVDQLKPLDAFEIHADKGGNPAKPRGSEAHGLS